MHFIEWLARRYGADKLWALIDVQGGAGSRSSVSRSGSCGSTARARRAGGRVARVAPPLGTVARAPRAPEGPRPRPGLLRAAGLGPDGRWPPSPPDATHLRAPHLQPDGSVRLRRRVTNFWPGRRTSPPARCR
jgi:hypothetical protein